MNNLQVGTKATLTVKRVIDTGYVLTNDDAEVLLHKNEAIDNLEDGDEVEVFLYQDKKGEIVATQVLPEADIDTYDWAEVVEVISDLGVFVDIGIQKAILVSKDDLPLYREAWPEVGDVLHVILDTDKKGRLLAVPMSESTFEDEFEDAPDDLMNQPISGRVIRSSREGAVIVTEEGYRGFIHYSESKRDPRLGEWVKGRVIQVKNDGTLNVSLRPLKQEAIDVDSETILEFLKHHDGVMPYSDKSDPEEIYNMFDMSKAAFKRALGKLMKSNRVEQKDGKTYIKEKDS
ncbi:CvfB family protein [Salirhabdus salicampi]|uniref:CvfB family protein n=1 Tax=Salirhabdus salicampi TaxID=476102 RepID=UPI0020C1BE3A|nr:S1-like domain-containing RNA-binding protein [Salirhabdus salicampi]MCP8616221.1 S1-like domain-containing RNA-binding protein [Salirhabdus salicampi]